MHSNPQLTRIMSTWSLFLCHCFTLLLIVVTCVQTAERYAAPYGSDTNSCTTLVQSCRTLGHVIKTSKTDDVIYVDAADDSRNWLCHEEPISIQHSLSIVGYNQYNKTPLGCSLVPNRLLYIEARGGSVDDVIQVRFERLVMSGVLLDVGNSRLVLEDLEMVEVKWNSDNSSYVGLNGFRVSMTGSGLGDTMQIKTTNHLDMSLENFTVANLDIALSVGSIDLRLTRGVITNYPHIQQNAYYGMSVTARYKTVRHSSIHLKDCRFEGIHSLDAVQAVQNINNASFKVHAERLSMDQLDPNVSVIIQRCQFINNERGMTLLGRFHEVRIEDSEFRDNIAMHAGAGLYIYTRPDGCVARINNCTFVNNSAGAFRSSIVKDDKTFRVIENEVRINAPCCKGEMSLVGKGGAIRVQLGNISVSNSEFLSNSARLLGGALFVDREGSLTIEDSYGENSADMKRHPFGGEFIYSNGILVIRQAQFKALSALNHVSVLSHSGTTWSMELRSIMVRCPMGYMLRTSNTSAYKIERIGLIKSYKLDHLEYFCESCPSNKYSIDHGYLNYNLTYTKKSYFTLKIDGEMPKPAYEGTYTHQSITCKPCPYGGRCHHELRPEENFWGYVSEQQRDVKFQRCPKGYCCSKSDCQGFNSCKKHRVGELCGVCKQGYSEAMFTADCVPNSFCDPRLGYPVMICSGILYFIFLLFQKDVRDLMFTKIVRLSESRLVTCFTKRIAKKIKESGPTDVGLDKDRPRIRRSHERDPVGVISSGDEIAVENGEHPLARSSSADGHHVSDPPENRENIEEINLEEINGDKPDQRSGRRTASDGGRPPSSPGPAAKPDLGVSFLVIIFFYFQDAQLLHIKTAFTTAEQRYKVVLREILAGLFQFRVELFQFMEKFCFLEDMTALKKVVIRVAMVPCVLVQFGIVYLVYRCCKKLRRNDQADSETRALATKQPLPPTFSMKLATGFTLAMLFTYQQLAASSFALLNCVPVGQHSVLFIQGTEVCYQSWQYGVMAYAGTCIVPFCLVLLIGPGLLEDRLIHLTEFFTACVIPLPFLVRWFGIRLRLYRTGSKDIRPPISSVTKSVTQILQGPFKEQQSKFFGKICGQGFLIGRRLLLVLLYTFVNDALRRVLCMLILCFVILLHHVHVLPYKDYRGNIAGSISAASLLLLGAINLVRAAFEAAEYVPHGPNAQLMYILDEVENCLTLWLPGLVMTFIIVMLLIKISFICSEKIRKIGGPKRPRASTAPDNDPVAIRLADLDNGRQGERSPSLERSLPPPPSPFGFDNDTVIHQDDII